MIHFDPLWTDRTNQLAYGVMNYCDYVILLGFWWFSCTSYRFTRRIDVTPEQLMEIGTVHTPYATPEQEKTIRRIASEDGAAPRPAAPAPAHNGGEAARPDMEVCARCGSSPAMKGDMLCAGCRREIPLPPPELEIYHNDTCPLCGKSGKDFGPSVHCSRMRAMVCIGHCFEGCAFMDDRTSLYRCTHAISSKDPAYHARRKLEEQQKTV